MPFSKLRLISDEIFGVPCSFSFTFFHIFDSPFTFSWVLIISDKLQWPRKGSWGTSWILPSKSGSKYFLKNIMTENIWKIFAPWRGPQVKLLFSTFFQVTVYLVDTQNFRVRWRPLHVFCKYLCKYWSYLIKKIFGILFWELSIMKKRFQQFGWKLKSQYYFWSNMTNICRDICTL